MAERIHHGLQVWREAIELVKDIYRVTNDFPKQEIFGLVSQMRRAAVSVASNIAEGAGRGGATEFKRFLVIARGSLSELETQVVLARELGFLDTSTPLDVRIEKVFSLMGGLLRSKSR